MISGGIEERSKKCARAEEKNVNNLTKEQLAHFSAFTIATQFMSYAKGGGGAPIQVLTVDKKLYFLKPV